MPSITKAPTQTFKIGYKGYYHEYSEWYSFYVEAFNERAALEKFAERFGIRQPVNVNSWRWEDGDWLMAFKYIKQVELRTCPHCNGTGSIAVAKVE